MTLQPSSPDIVERLRVWPAVYADGEVIQTCKLMQRAADEIERLRGAAQGRFNASEERVEAFSEIIYDAFPYRNGDSYHEAKPKWVPGGNSLMQDRARQAARAIVALLAPLTLTSTPSAAPAQTPNTEEARHIQFLAGRIRNAHTLLEHDEGHKAMVLLAETWLEHRAKYVSSAPAVPSTTREKPAGCDPCSYPECGCQNSPASVSSKERSGGS